MHGWLVSAGIAGSLPIPVPQCATFVFFFGGWVVHVGPAGLAGAFVVDDVEAKPSQKVGGNCDRAARGVQQARLWKSGVLRNRALRLSRSMPFRWEPLRMRRLWTVWRDSSHRSLASLLFSPMPSAFCWA